MTHHELVIIGAGPGGYVAAIKAAQLGIETVLIERGDMGGTCLNRGCIPTKTILHSAEVFSEIKNAASLGIRVNEASVDFDALRLHKDETVGTLRDGVAALLKANGVTVIHGAATIAGIGAITVVSAGDTLEELSADNLIIATGSAPALPPIAGIDLPGVLTSDSILESVPELKHLAIIGGGVIGMEFAGIYTALGTEVTVLEAASRILPTMDREFSQSLSMTMKKRGCTIATGAFVESINEGNGGELAVHYMLKDQPQAIEADAVLVSTGRVPALGNLFDQALELELDRGRIAVDAHMQTSIPHIYAIGDVANAGIQLAHAASAQGIVAVNTIAGISSALDPSLIASCVYTSPEIASVGVTEVEAKEAGIAVQIGKFAMAGNGKTIITGQDRSFAKVISDADGIIIGAQLMCGRATDMIGELAIAVANKLTAEQMASVIRPHPTFEEGIGEALESMLDGAIHAMPRKH